MSPTCEVVEAGPCQAPLWEWPQGQRQLALFAHLPSLSDGACASHPCAWPLDTSLQPKGCPFSHHHSHRACTCSSHKPSP